MPKDKDDKKKEYVDDGHTVFDMSGLYGPRKKKKEDGERLTRREKWAAIRAALATYIPILGMILAAFTLTALFLYFFWLN